MPTLPPVGEKMAVLIPRTFPSKLNSGPPELPRLIEASDHPSLVAEAPLAEHSFAVSALLWE